MQQFDFSDIVDDGDVSPVNVNEKAEEMVEVDEDLFGDEFDFEDEEEGSDVTDEDSDVTIETDLDSLPDDFSFKVGGVELSKADLLEKLNTHTAVAEKQSKLDKYFSNFEAIDRQMNERFIASATENDMKLNTIKNKLKDPNLLESEYGRLYRDKEALEHNSRVLQERVQQHFIDKEARDAQRDALRMEQINSTMEKRYGNEWVSKIGPELTQYIVDKNMASPELRKAVSPELLEVIYKAQQFDKLKASQQQKLKGVVNTKKATARAATSTGQAPKAKLTRSQAYERMMKSGNTTDAFNFLVD